MGKTGFLPAPDSPGGLQLAADYAVSTKEQRQEMCGRYGYMNLSSFQTVMKRSYSLSVPNHEGLTSGATVRVEVAATPTPPEPQETTINLTIPALRDYVPQPFVEGDKETMILHTSDWHMGKVTTSYNDEVGKERVGRLFDGVMSLTQLHRHMYPVEDLVIFDTGDRGQGENPHQGSKLGETSMGARDQQMKLVYPGYVELIAAFKQQFRTVTVHLMAGNHGHEKLAPETSRWDLYGADLIKTKLEGEPDITIHAHEGWSATTWVEGFKCFLAHFDGIPCVQGIPYFGINRKLLMWYIEEGGFNYAFGGHFHKRSSSEVTRRFEYFMSGSLVSDDEWALKKLGVSSAPSAWAMGMNPKRGVTWRYALEVDPGFRPEPVVQPIDPAKGYRMKGSKS